MYYYGVCISTLVQVMCGCQQDHRGILDTHVVSGSVETTTTGGTSSTIYAPFRWEKAVVLIGTQD